VYETGLSAEFRALHVMPGAQGPEGSLHPHRYRLEATLARRDLDVNGMVVDLDVLGGALEQIVALVRDRDLEIIRPAEAPAVTVEVFARWAHGRLEEALGGITGLLTVRIWESPTAFGGYAAELRSSS
jgi:6-pyruvoyl-tetrahydropterin synthase